jgi:hypothetical protein
MGSSSMGYDDHYQDWLKHYLANGTPDLPHGYSRCLCRAGPASNAQGLFKSVFCSLFTDKPLECCQNCGQLH